MSLVATLAPVSAPKNQWTALTSGNAMAYFEILRVGLARWCVAASAPSDPPGDTQGAHTITNRDGIIPLPDIDPGYNVYIWPVDQDQVVIITPGA